MKRIPLWLKAFLVNFIIGLCVIVPYVIKGNGFFTLSNDFNAQEISFNILMNHAVKSGEVLWNTGIDLGSNFIESFGFYNLGSPFVLLSLLFPAHMIPYVIPWMFVQKFAVAGMASALYLKRHAKCEFAIIIGSVLYAFSGYQCMSMLFYHFQDMVALFPFLMIGLEKLVEEKKKGYLALACAVNCLTNFVFFVGEVLFLILFFVIRYLIPAVKSKDAKEIKGMLLDIVFCMAEGMCGFLVSGIITIPVLNGLLNVPRAAQHLLPKDMLTLSTPAILTSLKAFFLPGELMSYPSSVWGNDWMTNAAYLPLFGVVFVIAYCIRKKDWLAKLLETCMVISFIPVLNSVFSMVSDSPYRRWYYMLILFMVLSTVRVMENADEYPVKKGAVVSLFAIGFFLLITLVIPWSSETESAIYEPAIYWYMIVIALLGISLAVWYQRTRRKWAYLWLVGIFAVITMSVNIARSQAYMDDSHLKWKELAEEGDVSQSEMVIGYLTDYAKELPADVAPYRYYFDEGIWQSYYNLAMTNALQSTNSFISTVNGSIFRFYEVIGNERQNMTPNEIPGIEELLGAKYIIVSDYLEESQRFAEDGENLILQDAAPTRKYADFKMIDTFTDRSGHKFYQYENPYALPIGFSYDAYILESELQQIDPQLRGIVMLQALVVEDEKQEEVSCCLVHWTGEQKDLQNVYAQDAFYDIISTVAMNRQTNACSNFEYARNSFSAVKENDRECYTFFSIPYDKYWHAFVNGEETEILDCAGLMAIRTGAGVNDIQFVYQYFPVKAGIAITAAGLLSLFGLLFFEIRRKPRHRS